MGLSNLLESREREAVSEIRGGIEPFADIKSGRKAGNCDSNTSPERKKNKKIRILDE